MPVSIAGNPKTDRISNALWVPSSIAVAESRLSTLVNHVNKSYALSLAIGNYKELHEWSISNPQKFWLSVARLLDFRLRPFPAASAVIQRPGPRPRLPSLVDVTWFSGCKLNYTDIVLRYRHLEPTRKAISFHNETGQESLSLTFSEVADQVSICARALRANGVSKGDTVATILSNTPEAAIILLATAAIGGVFSSVSPDFGQSAIHSRLSQSLPKVIFYNSGYAYKGKTYRVQDQVFGAVRGINSVFLLVEVPQPFTEIHHTSKISKAPHGCRHVSLGQFLEGGYRSEEFYFENMTMSDPLFMMYSSGTTGNPKCIIQGAGVLLNQMKEHAFHCEISESSVVFFNTSPSWMMFHWLVAVLASGATIVLYDGAALPSHEPFRLLNVAEKEHCTHFGAGAKYYQVLGEYHKKDNYSNNGLRNKFRIPTLVAVMGTGSPSPVENYLVSRVIFGKHVRYISMSGGTEINASFVSGCAWKEVIAPNIQCVTLGMDVQVMNKEGKSVTSQVGELVCLNSCPCMPLFFGHDPIHVKYRDAYFREYGEDVWCHRDFATITEEGGVIISGRSDATLNPGGVRLGTADIYDVVESVEGIDDSLVTEFIDTNDSKLILLVSLKQGVVLCENMKQNLKKTIRGSLSHRHVPYIILSVPEIPYTFSGKKLEVAVKNILQRKPISTEGVKNPWALKQIQTILSNNGLLTDYKPIVLPGRNAKL